jgi:hypothetical protein
MTVAFRYSADPLSLRCADLMRIRPPPPGDRASPPADRGPADRPQPLRHPGSRAASDQAPNANPPPAGSGPAVCGSARLGDCDDVGPGGADAVGGLEQLR